MGASRCWGRTFAFTLLVVFALALGLRCPHLGQRPMHNDEGVNAVKFCQFLEQGGYIYDPSGYHGPSLWYATYLLGRLTAAPDFEHYTEARLRALPVLCGVGLVLLLALAGDGLGPRGVLWAGLFTAVSPAMVFYSRYFIHEMLLVFFTFLALVAAWRYWRSRKLGWALLAGAGVGLMHTTKESFVVLLLAAAIALALNRLYQGRCKAGEPPGPAPPLCGWHLLAGVAVWVVVWLLLFSTFFRNPQGLLDSFRAYAPWLEGAGEDSAYSQPWYFYFHRLLLYHTGKGPVWTEALILVLALVGGGAGFSRKRPGGGHAGFVRFLALYTLLVAGAYSAFSYKTPWCLLSFWYGAILLAGVGAAVLVREARKRALSRLMTVLVLAGACHLGWQAWQASSAYAAQETNPYVYSQTTAEVPRVMKTIEALAQVSPERERMPIKVIASEGDYWPLPWYLRRFKQLTWCNEMPQDPFASVMLVSADLHARLDQRQTHLLVGHFQLRPGVFFEIYVEADLWQRWREEHPPNPADAL